MCTPNPYGTLLPILKAPRSGLYARFFWGAVRVSRPRVLGFHELLQKPYSNRLEALQACGKASLRIPLEVLERLL